MQQALFVLPLLNSKHRDAPAEAIDMNCARLKMHERPLGSCETEIIAACGHGSVDLLSKLFVAVVFGEVKLCDPN